jgi:hypothetical protein
MPVVPDDLPGAGKGAAEGEPTTDTLPRPLVPAFRRIGKIAKAAHYERLLAAVEARAPEAWAAEQGSTP